MLGEQPATVTSAKPFDLHGVTYWDFTLTTEDGTVLTNRIGAESVPEGGLQEGERVLAMVAANMVAANMVVAIRRP